MKIGTKANAIDDLGKFDGSKMTIKVNGKQIYPQKRYAIVRVDGRCPRTLEKNYGLKCSPKGCDGCEIAKNYGDTEEQLIKKVAQALELFMKKGYRTITSEEYAKFIVEFLGVE